MTTAAARSLLSSSPFHMWCPTRGMYCVRVMEGSADRTAVSHRRTWEEHSAIISIAGVRERPSRETMEGESFTVCWTRRLAAALKEKFRRESSVGMRCASRAQ